MTEGATLPLGTNPDAKHQDNGATSSFAQTEAKKPNLPVENNRFIVDSQAKEIQVLLTTDNPGSIQIVGPQGKSYNFFQKTEDPISWDRIGNLYAVKIQTPAEGQWEVQGKLLSGVQVLVTSDLKMITPTFPNNMLRGENLSLTAYLQEKGKTISNGDFLNHIQFAAKFNNVATNQVYKVYLMPKPHGYFHYDYYFDLLPGVYHLDFEAKGLLFQREQRQQIYVYDYPGIISTHLSDFADELTVDIHLFSPLLEISTCQLSALLHHIDGSAENVIIKSSPENGWQLMVPLDQGVDTLSVILVGYTKDARLVEVTFPQINVAQLFHESEMQFDRKQQAKSNAFWRKLQNAQVVYVLPLTQEKLVEQVLSLMSPFKNTDLMPLREYPSYIQYLLNAWEPLLFKTNKFSFEEDEDVAAPATAASLQKVAPKAVLKVAQPTQVAQPPQVSAKRKWLIGILFMLAILFLMFLVFTIVLLTLSLFPARLAKLSAMLGNEQEMEDERRTAIPAQARVDEDEQEQVTAAAQAAKEQDDALKTNTEQANKEEVKEGDESTVTQVAQGAQAAKATQETATDGTQATQETTTDGAQVTQEAAKDDPQTTNEATKQTDESTDPIPSPPPEQPSAKEEL